MALKDALRRAADTAIKKVGGDVTVNFITQGAYNTTSGEVSESITSETVKGVLDDIKNVEKNNLTYGASKTSILEIDKKLTVSALSLGNEPMIDDRVTIESVIYHIVRVDIIEQGNEAIVYEIYLRT